MQWSDVTKVQTPRALRQFGLLGFAVFSAWAASRAYGGRVDATTIGFTVAGLVLGGLGLAAPTALRPVFTVWMAAAFPIGWVVSRVVLAAIYYLLFTPIALVFKLAGRDPLHRRRSTATTYWLPKPQPSDSAQYFKQF